MKKKLKFLIVVGARPNFIKIAPLFEEIKKYKNIKPILVHTGQHYDYEMSQIFFQDLNIPKPNYNLGVGSGSHAYQTAESMKRLEPVLLKEKPDLVIVVGDVNSTLAGALVAAKLGIKTTHIEAGARGINSRTPEEINRLLTDHISDFLFTASDIENKNLLRENIKRERIFLVGNIMTDILLRYKKEKMHSTICERLKILNKKYAVLTIHRARIVDDKENLKEILAAIKEVSQKIFIVFPIHPRTQKIIEIFKLKKFLAGMPNLILIKPLSYLNMINLLKNSEMVLTDSGGLQHETTILGIPCLTLDETAVWPITVKQGTNLVVGISKEKIIREALKIINNGRFSIEKRIKIPRYWDGRTSQRIVKILQRLFLL